LSEQKPKGKSDNHGNDLVDTSDRIAFKHIKQMAVEL